MAKKKKYGIARTKPGPVIYIGPNLPGGALSGFTVFRGGLPAHVTEMQEKNPELKTLFVPVSELAAARKRLTRPSREAKAFQDLCKKFNL